MVPGAVSQGLKLSIIQNSWSDPIGQCSVHMCMCALLTWLLLIHARACWPPSHSPVSIQGNPSRSLEVPHPLEPPSSLLWQATVGSAASDAPAPKQITPCTVPQPKKELPAPLPPPGTHVCAPSKGAAAGAAKAWVGPGSVEHTSVDVIRCGHSLTQEWAQFVVDKESRAAPPTAGVVRSVDARRPRLGYVGGRGRAAHRGQQQVGRSAKVTKKRACRGGGPQRRRRPRLDTFCGRGPCAERRR
jgi:hypothetical protein